MFQISLITLSAFALVLFYCASTDEESFPVLGNDLHDKQLAAFKRMLSSLGEGVYPTCNFVLFANLSSFADADSHCKSFDIGTGRVESGHLATINNAETNDDMINLLNTAYPVADNSSLWAETNWVWSGLRKVKNTKGRGWGGDRKFKIRYNPTEWRWADGSSPEDFEMWRKGGKSNQPDQWNRKYGVKGCNEIPVCRQNYMRISRAGDWDDAFKFEKHPYVCDYQGKYILSAEKMEWHDANQICKDGGLQLAKIESEADVEVMKSAIIHFLGEADPTWKRWDDNNWIWVGGTDWEFEGIWKWTDGTFVETWDLPWIHPAGKDNSKKQKEFKIKGQDVLAFNRDGLFDDSFEKSKHRGFACQCPGKFR